MMILIEQDKGRSLISIGKRIRSAAAGKGEIVKGQLSKVKRKNTF